MRGQVSDAVTLLIDTAAPQQGRTHGASRIEVHPLGAIKILSMPFHLIVEDETSDGGFLLWMARYTGRDEIIRAYTSGRFIFRHAGGKGQFPKAASALSYGVWPRLGRPVAAMKLRCGALMDGDERYLSHKPNTALMRATAAHVAFTHILGCRTIESYVPFKYFRRRLAMDGLGAVADHYFQLEEDQRKYFAIKSGYLTRGAAPRAQTHSEFVKDMSRPAQERSLFATVDTALWDKIAGGFGERLSSVFMSPGLRCNPGERSELTASQASEINAVLTRLVRYL